MDNCTYNKIKILHELSKVSGFIERYARKDARAVRHAGCHAAMQRLHSDLQRHLKALHRELKKAKL